VEKTRVNFKKMYYGFPVFLVSFYDENGIPNITTLSSSFTLRDMICLGAGNKSYAANQIIKVKDFVVNIPDESLMKEIDICGSVSGIEHQKFSLAGLTPQKSEVINAPLIEECPIAIECSLVDVIKNENFPMLVTLMGQIKGRVIATHLLDKEEHLLNFALNPVLWLGDDAQRVYRYVEQGRFDKARSFLG